MPLPKPKKGQKKDDFINACMANDTMVSEYDNNKQRYAVCNSLWKKKELKSVNNYEMRTYPVEFRVEKKEEKEVLVGYGAVYNSKSVDLGGFKEIILPGAFKRSLKEGNDIKSFFNHDPNLVLGSTKAGTLKLKDDERGLLYEIDMPNTSYANDLRESMKRGDVRGSSFSFNVIEDEWKERDGKHTRYLKDVDIHELGPVTNPAYEKSNSGIKYRSADEVFETHTKEIEKTKGEEEREKTIKESGLEIEKLTEIIIRAKSGLEEADYEIIKANIEVLKNYLPAPSDGTKGGKDDERQTGRLSMIRKRLDILEKTLND